VTTVEQLWALPPSHVRAIWGGVGGERFWAFLHGYDIEREATERGMFGHSRVLGFDWRTPEKTEECARLLLVKATRRMRREGYSATVLSLGLRGQGSRGEKGPAWYGERRLSAFRDDRTALMTLTGLFERARREKAHAQTKKVHVTLTGLIKTHLVQPDLLDRVDEMRGRARWERLSDLTDALHARYNAPVLTLGPKIGPPGEYAGAKIAFGRIPDLADF
jgi:DNA polymerase IV